ncbi:hypothetical protein BC939DRAFT_476360 [Gamsiella multidivaricata]|uniref:uncharacterized protein n=1 Tax=Gamsiella multidivaricata TaxID=101098 RepID=UPI00222089A9|nr:uncharacterized protein BC939DRAFT_476360 [Gamsiella multidivaricata]KAI7825130.1 hypothetical protein BC939DRAFT_476360 [Gamsiella multidivaricata]
MTKNFSEGCALEVDHILGSKLFENFRPCKVHIDGDMTAEKAKARLERTTSSYGSSSSNSLSINNISSEINVLDYLPCFYGHKWFRKKTWDAKKKAQIACLDYSIRGTLRKAGGRQLGTM